MSRTPSSYFEVLVTNLGAAWDRFWFTPVDPTAVALLRCLTGAMACWFLVAFAFDLTVWYGVDGLLPAEMAYDLESSGDTSWNGRLSILAVSDHPAFLIAVHVAALVVAVAFTVGLATRATGVVLWGLVLSYIHRGPLLMGPFEPVLTFMLGYLCLTPCGRRYSVDNWWRAGRSAGSTTQGGNSGDAPVSVAANIGQRLMQVHVALLYAVIGLTKLGGDVWWNGEAMWWLIAHPESRLVDLTFLHPHEFLLNLWTHGSVAFELGFAILIWNRLARPILLAAAVVHWFAIGVITGQVSYSLMMIVAGLSFLQPVVIRGSAVADH